MQEMNDKSKEISIGRFTLYHGADGSLWLGNTDDESMQMGEETLSAFETILEAFWEANF